MESLTTSPMRRLGGRALVLCLATLGAMPSEAKAQHIEGRVVDAATGAPVPSALLRLRTLTGDTVWSTVADDSGRFILRAAQSGSFMVDAQSLGYRPSEAGPIRLEDARATVIELRLSSTAIPLEGIRVIAQPNNPGLERAGFYSRKRFGFGTFIDRAELDRRAHQSTVSLFRGRPGIRVMRTSGGRAVIVLRGGIGSSMRAGSYCAARVLINGLEAYEFDLEMDLDIDAIEGIEIFRGASSVPAEFGGANSMCGVVLFWLRTS